MTANGIRHKGTALAAVAVGGVLALTVPTGVSMAQDVPDVRISISPGDGTQNAGADDGARVTAEDGRLTDVRMTDVVTGQRVDGSVAGGGHTWRADDELEPGTKYRITAEAEDRSGADATSNSTFTTGSAEDTVVGHVQHDPAGKTLGVGMYPSIEFDKPVENKAAVESAIDVTASSGQEVVGHWFGDKRLDFRPAEYFEPGTTVTTRMNLDGVEASPGVHGVQDRTVTYDVGRRMVSTVDAADKTLTVRRDGQVVRQLPVSAGDARTPTWNGTMVVSEKHEETRMNGSTVGFTDKAGRSEYDIPDVPHAMRLSSSGTFLHGNYWSGENVFGERNTSHGCVGLADVQGADDPGTDAAWFYGESKPGDIVNVENSPDETVAPDNGLSGWNLDWGAWQEGSALR